MSDHRAESLTVNAAGLVQGIALVTCYTDDRHVEHSALDQHQRGERLSAAARADMRSDMI
ncbi:MAG: hypothetical protein WAK76_09990 [Trebonia sp.]